MNPADPLLYIYIVCGFLFLYLLFNLLFDTKGTTITNFMNNLPTPIKYSSFRSSKLYIPKYNANA